MKLSSAAISLFLSVATITNLPKATTVDAFSPTLVPLPLPVSATTRSPSSSSRLHSTLAPPESQMSTGFDDDNDSTNNDIGNTFNKKHSQVIKKIDKTSFYPLQDDASATSTTSSSSEKSSLSAASPASPSVFGPIAMSMDELAQHMGGLGRARLVWDCYKVGIDPSNLYGQVMDLGPSWEDYETILGLMPSQRRSQRLSQSSIDTLEGLIKQSQLQQQQQHRSTTTSGSSISSTGAVSQNNNSRPQIENGVATLSYISRSGDGTTKLLLKLADGLQVECVIIPWKNQRSTLCISSQVGCRQGCTFCATGRMGKLRNLSADEILAQMFWAVKMCRLEGLPEISNVVFMGMGEPSDNAENVVQATKILTTREMYQLSANRVTVSTVAPSPSSFMDFAQSPCVLAWSVHAANDDLRKKLVPTTKYSMAELRQGLIDALLMKPMNARTCMLEVALMKGVNDQLEHADELAQFTQVIIDSVPGVKPHINLIPYNDIGPPSSASNDPTKMISGVSTPPVRYERPDNDDVMAFQKRLQSLGMYVHIRSTRGDDKTAACGQLATKKQKKMMP